jgi:hypothetical protein
MTVTVPPSTFDDRVLLTVHGVMSDNSRLALLRERCEKALPGLISDSYFYGSVVPFQSLTEETALLIFRAVRDKLELVHLKYLHRQNRRLYVVAHSFGTLAVIRALEMHVAALSLEALVLLGSIVPRSHYWDGLVSSKQLNSAPLATIRPLDTIVRFGRAVGGGDSGARGFIANGHNRPIESYKSGGHSAYFPADVEDVIALIRDGGAAPPEHPTFDSWYSTTGMFTRLRYRVQQLVL